MMLRKYLIRIKDKINTTESALGNTKLQESTKKLKN